MDKRDVGFRVPFFGYWISLDLGCRAAGFIGRVLVGSG